VNASATSRTLGERGKNQRKKKNKQATARKRRRGNQRQHSDEQLTLKQIKPLSSNKFERSARVGLWESDKGTTVVVHGASNASFRVTTSRVLLTMIHN
jgi:hypothetical protein